MRNVTLATALVLAVAATALAGQDGTKYGIHTIRGFDYDRAALEKLLDDSEGPAEVKAYAWGIREVKGRFRLDKNKPVEEAALDFIDRHRHAFKLKDPKRELKLRDDKPSWHMSFQQYYNGIPVWQHSIGIHLGASDEIYRVQGSLIPTPDIDTTPLVTEEEAVEIVKKNLKIPLDAQIWPPEVELVIYSNILAYKVLMNDWLYFIDAKDGEVISKQNITKY